MIWLVLDSCFQRNHFLYFPFQRHLFWVVPKPKSRRDFTPLLKHQANTSARTAILENTLFIQNTWGTMYYGWLTILAADNDYHSIVCSFSHLLATAVCMFSKALFFPFTPVLGSSTNPIVLIMTSMQMIYKFVFSPLFPLSSSPVYVCLLKPLSGCFTRSHLNCNMLKRWTHHLMSTVSSCWDPRSMSGVTSFMSRIPLAGYAFLHHILLCIMLLGEDVYIWL